MAVIFGVVCVCLTIRQNVWCWPTGLVQVILFIYIFYEVRLYSDLILHVIYVGLSIYGWVHWVKGGQGGQPLPVTRMTRLEGNGWLASVLVGAALWGAIMAAWTNAAAPYPDSFTTVASLAAQWLMARKKLESWLFWISVDVVAIGVYVYKALYLTAGLYAVFLVLACLGYTSWRKAFITRQAQA